MNDEEFRNSSAILDDRGDPVGECVSCHKWFPAEELTEHEYYCSGRAEADEYEADREESDFAD